jgi:hypothetical protein
MKSFLRSGYSRLIFFAVCGITLLGLLIPSPKQVAAQQPTGSVPTVTSTPLGPLVKVDPVFDFITVYSGPSSFDYPAVGLLLKNETAPAIGRARDKLEWIQIHYPGIPGSVGWIYGPYVGLSPGAFLPLVDPPSTPTPVSTPTIDPTLEARFIGQLTPTRLPTFTPPPPLDLPQINEPPNPVETSLPAGLMILILVLIGVLGAVISYLRGR